MRGLMSISFWALFLFWFFSAAYAQESIGKNRYHNSGATIDQIIKQAQNYLKNKDYDAAINEMTKAISLFPEDDTLYYFRGEAYYTKDTTAEVSFMQTKDLLSKEDTSLAWSSLRENTFTLMEAAIKDFNKAIGINPNNPLYFFSRAQIWYSKGDYDNALSDLDKAISLKNDVALFYEYRGLVYDYIQNPDKSIEDYTKAINLLKVHGLKKPLSSFAKYYDVNCALEHCDSQKPSELLGKVYYKRGTQYENLGQQQKAFNDYKQALILNPEAYYTDRIIDTYTSDIEWREKDEKLKSEKIEIAFKLLNEVIKHQPKYASFFNKKFVIIYYVRGKAYENLGQQQKAFNDYKQFLILAPEHYLYLFFKILKTYEIILEKDENAKKEKIDKALILLNAAISQQSKYASLYKIRADIYKDKKQYQKALEDYLKAIQMNPKGASIYSSRGDVYEELNQIDNAIKDYSKAIELEPEDAFNYSSSVLFLTVLDI